LFLFEGVSRASGDGEEGGACGLSCLTHMRAPGIEDRAWGTTTLRGRGYTSCTSLGGGGRTTGAEDQDKGDSRDPDNAARGRAPRGGPHTAIDKTNTGAAERRVPATPHYQGTRCSQKPGAKAPR